MAAGESKTHKRLREDIIDHLENEYHISSSEIFTDGSGEIGESNLVPRLGNSFPDVYSFSEESKQLFIGEAKATWEDFYENGLKKQVKDFLEEIKLKEDMFLLKEKKIILSVNKSFSTISTREVKKRFSQDYNYFDIITR